MLKGRLGLETARIPHVDRYGLIWLSRGKLYASEGTLRFSTAGDGSLDAGDYSLPFQTISNVLLGPGGTVSHDALRILCRQGTGLLAVGEDGVRFYSAMPFGPDNSTLARKQASAWADEGRACIDIARRMYAWRLGEVLPRSEIAVLRGIEGARMKKMYEGLARQYGVAWRGRKYDRKNPDKTDLPNQAINQAATAVQGAAQIAVAATGTIPQLGFIHEDSGNSFCLDIADLFRDSITIPVAFEAVSECQKHTDVPVERIVRRMAGQTLQKKKVIPKMIDRIKELFNANDDSGN